MIRYSPVTGVFLGFGSPVDVDAECANVVVGLSIGFLCVCVAGAVFCCVSCVTDTDAHP